MPSRRRWPTRRAGPEWSGARAPRFAATCGRPAGQARPRGRSRQARETRPSLTAPQRFREGKLSLPNAITGNAVDGRVATRFYRESADCALDARVSKKLVHDRASLVRPLARPPDRTEQQRHRRVAVWRVAVGVLPELAAVALQEALSRAVQLAGILRDGGDVGDP